MTLRPLCLLLLAAPASASRVAVPRLSVPVAYPVGAGMLYRAPALSLAAPSNLSMSHVAPVSLIPPALPALPLQVAAALGAVPADASLEDHAAASRARFDFAAPKDGDAAPVWAGGRDASPAPALAPGWTLNSFPGEGGAEIYYKSRAVKDRSLPARVYAGGLALNESFDTFFSRGPAQGPEHFLWTRAHAPSGWVPTRSPLDADALDMARMLVTAAKTSSSKKTELVLHSFGTLVFQRMLQLRGAPVVDAALAGLAGSRVVFLHGTTRYEGSERRAGREFEQMGRATRAFTDWLNTADSMVELWEKTARMNPFLGPAVDAWLASWRIQREQVLALASRDAINMMRRDLAEPWAPELDAARLASISALERNARDPRWQEALLRRSGDMFRLAMTPADLEHLRKLKVDLTMVHARGDKLLNWETARVLFEYYGLPAPAELPPAGTVLSGRGARAVIVDGDHYWPLKHPDALRRVLDR